MDRSTKARCMILLAGTLCVLASPAYANAQSGGDGFLFRTPNLALIGRVGYALPTAASDIFSFTTEQLTVDKADFNAPYFGGQVAVRATRRVDVIVDGGWTGGTVESEFRDWVGNDDLPIVQTTDFSRWYLTGGAKAYLNDRGRTLGRFVWVPNRWAPYVSGGVGLVWYRFEQVGEFVDFETLEIFNDQFRSSANTLTVHGSVGLDISMGSRTFLNTEARYGWGSAGVRSDFVGFGDIDLSGFQATLGIGVRL